MSPSHSDNWSNQLGTFLILTPRIADDVSAFSLFDRCSGDIGYVFHPA